MKWRFFFSPVMPPAALAVVLVACAGSPQLAYESAPDPIAEGGGAADPVDSGEARALEQAESDCARQGKHAVSKRVEGETIYDCVDSD